MELSKNLLQMLQLIERPAFFVNNGRISHVNAEASYLRIPVGTHVQTLLKSDYDVYKEHPADELTLNISIGNSVYPTSIQHMDGLDLFVMQPGAGMTELKTLAMASQQLRNPISSMLGSADALRQLENLQTSPEAKEHLQVINHNLLKLHRLMGNMADAGRYRSSRIPVMEKKNISALLDEVMEKIISKTSDVLPVQIRYTGLTENIYCLIDSELLERAVYNLISNSLKVQSTCIHVEVQRKKDSISIVVEDNGAGLPENMKQTLFSRYMREPSLSEYGYGLGLGMTIIHAAATAHNGTVLVEHPQAGGMRVSLIIPIITTSDHQVKQPISMLHIDYLGGFDAALTELSDVLPPSVYDELN